MAKLLQLKRLQKITLILLGLYCLVGVRLVETHVFDHDQLYAKEIIQSKRVKNLRPERGEIRDLTGRILAGNEDVKTLNADPTQIGDQRFAVSRILAKHLGKTEAEWAEQLATKPILDDGKPRMEDGKPVYDQHVYLQENVPVQVWEALHADLQRLDLGKSEDQLTYDETLKLRALRRAVYATDAQKRIYPQRETACHLVGFLRKTQKKTRFGVVDDYEGAYGIEHSLDEALAGSWGYRYDYWYPKSRNQLALRRDDVPPVPGMNIYLTIDLRIQQFVEEQLELIREEHDPDTACALVIRPETGEILALANIPEFDPNESATFTNDRIRNRAISDALDPGSVFKIVTISAALNENVVTLNSKFFCENGLWLYNGKTLKDDAHEFGDLTVKEIVQYSSNIGTAKVGLKLGERRLFEYIQRFGFGARTGIPVIGESLGLVNPPNEWDGITITRVAIGQSIGVTPLQMAMAFAAIANDGLLMRPKIIDRIEDFRGTVKKYPPQCVRQVVRPEVARKMTTALKAVLTEGTGRRAVLEHYHVAGKTGTAQQAGYRNGVWTMRSGKYAALFIGFFPADDPELCVAVVVNNPKKGSIYGGTTAAPYWKQIASQTAQYLNIKPDKTIGSRDEYLAALAGGDHSKPPGTHTP